MSELRWIETHGRKPRTGDALLHLKFRNGLTSLRPYAADKIVWKHRDPSDPCHNWDVTHCARVVE